MTYFLHEQLSFPKDIVLLIDDYLFGGYEDIPHMIANSFDNSKAFEDNAQQHYSPFVKSYFLPKTLDKIMTFVLFRDMQEQLSTLSKQTFLVVVSDETSLISLFE